MTCWHHSPKERLQPLSSGGRPCPRPTVNGSQGYATFWASGHRFGRGAGDGVLPPRPPTHSPAPRTWPPSSPRTRAGSITRSPGRWWPCTRRGTTLPASSSGPGWGGTLLAGLPAVGAGRRGQRRVGRGVGSSGRVGSRHGVVLRRLVPRPCLWTAVMGAPGIAIAYSLRSPHDCATQRWHRASYTWGADLHTSRPTRVSGPAFQAQRWPLVFAPKGPWIVAQPVRAG